MSADRLMPRDKALEYGIESLNNSELLALIIKSAYKEKDVFALAEEIISMAGGFEHLLSLSYEELISIKGIKKAKAMEILSILEISRRLSRLNTIRTDNIDSIDAAAKWIKMNIAFKYEESFFVIYMNQKCQIIKSEELFKGNSHSAAIGVDTLIRRALLLKSNTLIIAHNHPSEGVEPSPSDISLTTKIKEALTLMDIKLLDHIIVSKGAFFSFKKSGLL